MRSPLGWAGGGWGFSMPELEMGMISSPCFLQTRGVCRVQGQPSFSGRVEASFNARSPKGIKDIYFTFARLYIFYK